MSMKKLSRGACGIFVAVMMVGIAQAQAGYQSVHTGQGTFYGYSGGGNCSLPLPSGILTAAMNAVDYNGAQACGAYIEVTNLNTSQSVIVRIDDQCPGCAVGNVDLSQPAFAQISPLAAGQIPISWKYVSGPSTTAKVVFKEGSSQWWTGIQVRDHRNPVAMLAYRTTGSSSAYTSVEREAYNYFIAPSGMGAGPYDLQITDVFGQVITVSGIGLAVSTEIALGAQFPLVLPAGGSSSSGSGSATPLPATTSVSVNSDWGQGYCDDVSVTNPNTTPLNWTVSLTIVGTMYTFWNANLSQAGSSITGTGVTWNQTLAAGGVTQFGFCANR
jgi:expansin (peptidoglycan-binding protein)